jgi:hypothetical protein
MSAIGHFARASCLVSLMALLAGCIVAPPDGYYDRGHDRYYHDRAWHDCRDRGGGRGYGDDRRDRDDHGDRDEHCR